MARQTRPLDLLLVALLAPALVQAAPAKNAPPKTGTTIYCCDDPKGQRVCGNILPEACYGTSYREISPRGTVRREEPPPLTAEEIARRKAAEEGRREMEARMAKQRRLDAALLDTYGSLADLENRRDRALGDMDRVLATQREREATLVLRRDKLKKERERRPGVEAVEADLQNAENELKTQRELVAAKQKERDALHAKYEDERRRYIELTGNAAARP